MQGSVTDTSHVIATCEKQGACASKSHFAQHLAKQHTHKMGSLGGLSNNTAACRYIAAIVQSAYISGLTLSCSRRRLSRCSMRMRRWKMASSFSPTTRMNCSTAARFTCMQQKHGRMLLRPATCYTCQGKCTTHMSVIWYDATL